MSARGIVIGVEIEGAASDEVLTAALEAMDCLSTGDVSGAQGVEASDDIVTGFRYLDPQTPDREAFVADLKALREVLDELKKQPGATAEIEAVAKSLDDAITEAQKKEPLGKLVFKRYICDNPGRWELDRYHPDATGPDPQAVALCQLLKDDV